MLSHHELVERWISFLNRQFIDENDHVFTYQSRVLPFFDGELPNSFNILYHHIDLHDLDLAEFSLQNPTASMKALREAILDQLFEDNDEMDEPGYMTRGEAAQQIWEPRLLKLHQGVLTKINKVNSSHIGKLISVPGIVQKISTPKLLLHSSRLKCARCNTTFVHQWLNTSTWENEEPLECPKDQNGCGRSAASTKFMLVDQQALHTTDLQKIALEERPEVLEQERQPRKITCLLQKDLIDAIYPGDRVVVHSIPTAFERKDKLTGTITFEKVLNVHSIDIEEKIYEDITFSEEDVHMIGDMPNDPEFMSNLIASIAPTIKGRLREKEALAYQQAGGVTKHMNDGSRIRGDIHILLIGDPGTAKTQLLRYQYKISPRGVFTSGKTTTAAGLTAAAIQNEFGDGGWTLEAGALVKADKGLCAIDELDKMSPTDRGALHDAMEAQEINPAKAGMVARFRTRASVVAAANPKSGQFDETRYQGLYEQFDLPPTLFSRFDLVFPIVDRVNPDNDYNIATHIGRVQRGGQIKEQRLHQSTESQFTEDDEHEQLQHIDPIYPPELLKKYFAYVKKNIFPVISQEAQERLTEYYTELRKTSKQNDDVKHIPITPRQQESLYRISEASAKLRQSSTIDFVDVERAISIFEYWVSQMKLVGMDMSEIATGLSYDQHKRVKKLIETVRAMVEEKGDQLIHQDELVQFAITDLGYEHSKIIHDLDVMLTKGNLFGVKKEDGLYIGVP